MYELELGSDGDRPKLPLSWSRGDRQGDATRVTTLNKGNRAREGRGKKQLSSELFRFCPNKKNISLKSVSDGDRFTSLLSAWSVRACQ